MDALNDHIREIRPDDPEVAPLVARHLALMRASSPACSVHAMDAGAMIEAGLRFFALVEEGRPVAMGALKRLSAGHGEIKSMHVAEAARGRGLARAMLARLLDAAREAGLSRVSLETGAQPAFAPARTLYKGAGFVFCPPFEGYEADPNSVFLTRRLGETAPARS